MHDHHYDHVVVGAGISGLAAAHYAAYAGQETLVLDAAERPGGAMQTHRFNALDGYWVEAGSHSCFNSYGNLLAIMERLGLLGRITAKAKLGYRLWRGGRRRGIVSALHPLELLGALPRLFTSPKEDKTVAEYYGRVLGKKNYRDLFGPAFRSVICQNADDYPAEALFRKKPRRKDILRSFSMPGGLSDIPQAIAAQPGIELRLGARVGAIHPRSDGVLVQLEGGDTFSSPRLTLAVAPDVAASLLAEVNPQAAAVVAGIGMAEIDTRLLVFAKEDLPVPPLAGLISVDGQFLSAVSRDFLDDPRYRGFAFHFPGGLFDQAQQLAAACAALATTPAQVVATAQISNRLPSLRRGHLQVIAALDVALANTAIGVTGNWFLGVSIEDCITRSRAEHERRFSALPATI